MKDNTIGREYSIDALRVFACFMVILAHACEFFYIQNFWGGITHGPSGPVVDWVAYRSQAVWAGIFDSLCRISVPTFVVISGYLLLPMKPGMTAGQFYKRRLSRVLIPFAVWCIIYSMNHNFHLIGDVSFGKYLSAVGKDALEIPFNYGTRLGHMWYVYMIVGLYLLVPFISPWIEKAGKKEMRLFLGLWVFSLFIPLIRLWRRDLFGECYWNPTSTFTYFSGFIGYFVFGAYCRKFKEDILKHSKLFGWVFAVCGYVLCLGIFLYKISPAGLPEKFNPGSFIQDIEFGWMFDFITVAMTTMGVFLLFLSIPERRNWTKNPLLLDVSKLSYGMYLAHILILNMYYKVYNDLIACMPLKILAIAVSCFVTVYAVIKLLSFLPKSKYIVG